MKTTVEPAMGDQPYQGSRYPLSIGPLFLTSLNYPLKLECTKKHIFIFFKIIGIYIKSTSINPLFSV